LRRHLKPTNKSWRVEETYVRVQGRWCYLYVINPDLAPIYGSAITDIKKEEILRSLCLHRPVQYWNTIIEQYHRAKKRRVNAKQGFREFQAARLTTQGYEAMHIIRKGQVRWLSGSGVRRQNRFIDDLFEMDT
jgi:IS6 family transposase